MECVHLCPLSERAWYIDNGMDAYNSTLDDTSVDNPANAVTMRSDIHQQFDRRRFVIVRKCDAWVAHFMKETIHTGKIYRNRHVEISPFVSPQFFFSPGWRGPSSIN